MGVSCCMYVSYWPFNRPPLPDNSQISYHNCPDQKKRMKVVFSFFSSSLSNNPGRIGKQKLPAFLKDKSSTHATTYMQPFLNRMMNTGGAAPLRLTWSSSLLPYNILHIFFYKVFLQHCLQTISLFSIHTHEPDQNFLALFLESF